MLTALMLAAVMAAYQKSPEPESAHLVVELRVIQGDPLGSVEEGTQTLLTEPKLVTMSGRPAFFRQKEKKYFTRAKGPVIDAADLVPLGTECEVLPILRGDGKVYVEVNAKTTVVKGAEGKEVADENSIRVSVVLEQGQTFKRRLAQHSATDQTWVEWSVRKQEQAVK